MDTSAIGQFVAKFMEQTENDWPDGSTIEEVALVVDLKTPTGYHYFLTACTDERLWVQEKFLEKALENVEYAQERVDDNE